MQTLMKIHQATKENHIVLRSKFLNLAVYLQQWFLRSVKGNLNNSLLYLNAI